MSDYTHLKQARQGNYRTPYKKEFNEITGSVTASLLLQQIVFRASAEDLTKPFYKFKEPCSHEKYKEGDSWCEELGFSRSEFDTALAKIGTKIKRGVSKAATLKQCEPTALVLYWTDASRVTWYMLNAALLDKAIFQLYLVYPHSSFTFFTENTTENTHTIAESTADSAPQPNPEQEDTQQTPPLPDKPHVISRASCEAKKAKTQPPAKPRKKSTRPRDLHFEAIAELCYPGVAYDKLATVRGKLNKATSDLKKLGVTPEQIVSFGKWWYRFDFRGKKGDKPKPQWVTTEWPNFLAAKQSEPAQSQALAGRVCYT